MRIVPFTKVPTQYQFSNAKIILVVYAVFCWCVNKTSLNIICMPSNNHSQFCALLVLILNQVSVFKFGQFYHEIQTLNVILLLVNVERQLTVAKLVAILKILHTWTDHLFLFTTHYSMKEKQKTGGMLIKKTVQLNDMYYVSCNWSLRFSTAERCQ